MDLDPPDRPIVAAMLQSMIDRLPPSYTVRWGPARKAQVVDAIEGGLLRVEDALDRYRMSVEEYHAWRRDLRERRAHRVRKALAFGRRRVRGAAGDSLPPPG